MIKKKKLLLLLILFCSVNTIAQVKDLNQLLSLGKKTLTQASATLTASKWKKFEDGKLDTLYYIRFVPATMDSTNVGDNVMCFYKKKDTPLNYIVFQTVNKKLVNKYVAELKKGGFILADTQKKPGEKKDIYSNRKCNVSVVEAKPKATDPLCYLIGIRYP